MKEQFACWTRRIIQIEWQISSCCSISPYGQWQSSKRQRAQICLRRACHPLVPATWVLNKLCWDNSYYCLLSFMIGFHMQYDLLITVLRTSKGHLSHPISISVNKHHPTTKEDYISLHHRRPEMARSWKQTCFCNDWLYQRSYMRRWTAD